MSVDPGEPGSAARADQSLAAIRGAAELTSWFGVWPSFHDAEIISLQLNRGSVSLLRLHCWSLGARDPATGLLARERECVVQFSLTAVSDLELADFSVQNVIAGLQLLKTPTGWRLDLLPCFGLAGYIDCAQVALSFSEGPPAGPEPSA